MQPVVTHTLHTVAWAFALHLALSPVVDAQETITIAGSSTMQPVITKASKVYAEAHPEVAFAVGQGGSSAGIEKASTGEVMIGMTSRDLKSEERVKNPDLVITPIGIDGIAMVVNAKNPLVNLTKDQVVGIFTGTITSWKELGGDGPVELLAEQPKSGTADAFKHFFALDSSDSEAGAPGKVLFKVKSATAWPSVGAQRIGTVTEILAAVITKPQAISFTSVGAAERLIAKGAALKLVSYEGIAPSTAAIRDGTYPLSRPLNLVYKPGLTDGAKAFVTFMAGAEGQALISAAEFLPVVQ